MPDAAPSRHGRLPWPTPEALAPDARAVHEAIAGGPRASVPRLFALATDEGRLEGPFNSMLTAPEVGLPLQELGAAIRYRTSLTDRCREIAILLVAADARSDYEWYAHEAVGRHIGLTDEELAALKAGAIADSFDATESAVATLTSMLIAKGTVDEAVHGRLEEVLGTRAITEIVVLVGYYHTLNLLMGTWDPPLPAGVAAPFADQGAHAATLPDGERGAKS